MSEKPEEKKVEVTAIEERIAKEIAEEEGVPEEQVREVVKEIREVTPEFDRALKKLEKLHEYVHKLPLPESTKTILDSQIAGMAVRLIVETLRETKTREQEQQTKMDRIMMIYFVERMLDEIDDPMRFLILSELAKEFVNSERLKNLITKIQDKYLEVLGYVRNRIT